MSINPIFQLTTVSQNDQPDSICPGCAVGTDIHAYIINYGGGRFLPPSKAKPPYPSSNEQLHNYALLPIPGEKTPSPTWFFEIIDGIENFWVELIIRTPGYVGTNIRICGANMPYWTSVNQQEPTNQIWAYGSCGVFGYAQQTEDNDFTNWIYTVTGGVCKPEVHG